MAVSKLLFMAPMQESGVQFSDGDGTVPLLSLGALCEGWRTTKLLNPANVSVTIREYVHAPTPREPRCAHCRCMLARLSNFKLILMQNRQRLPTSANPAM
jgi:hypothetical protein